LRTVGLPPGVVHGGGREITCTVVKLGGKAEFGDGQRVTNACDVKVVVMVLTGSVTTELVTLLNGNAAELVVAVPAKHGGQLRPADLETLLNDGPIVGGMKAKAKSILKVLSAGVHSVHLLDGRVPHSIIGELFTDNGVGSWIRA